MLPVSLKNHIASIGEQFGGYDTVSRLLPEDQVIYLATFPGSFFVVSPWSLFLEGYRIDFRYAGHIPGEPYRVYNREFIYLFSGQSEFFGDLLVEQNLVSQAYHGEYFHVELTTELGPRLVILWVCKELAPAIQERILKTFRQKAQPRVVNEHEIFVDCKDRTVRVYSSVGQSFEKSAASFIDVNGGIIRLTPKVNTWYGFEVDSHWFRVSLTGDEEHRWVNVGEVYQFKAQNQYQAGLDVLDLGNFNLSRSGYAHLYGVLETGTQFSDTSPDTIRTVISAASITPIEGGVTLTSAGEGFINGKLWLLNQSNGILTHENTSSVALTSVLSSHLSAQLQSGSSSISITSTLSTIITFKLEPSLVSGFSSGFEEESFELRYFQASSVDIESELS